MKTVIVSLPSPLSSIKGRQAHLSCHSWSGCCQWGTGLPNMEKGSHWPLHTDTGQGIKWYDVTFRHPWFTQDPAPGADLVSTRGDRAEGEQNKANHSGFITRGGRQGFNTNCLTKCYPLTKQIRMHQPLLFLFFSDCGLQLLWNTNKLTASVSYPTKKN